MTDSERIYSICFSTLDFMLCLMCIQLDSAEKSNTVKQKALNAPPVVYVDGKVCMFQRPLVRK